MSPHPHPQNPAQGPRILFFTGGTALRALSLRLPAWTLRSIHLVTPFDSGGSSAALRQALEMPAVGDLRNRILALADTDSLDALATHDLLAHRLPGEGPGIALRAELDHTLRRAHPAVRDAAHTCLDAVGPDFDLRHASVGNLVLAGLFLAEGRSLLRAAEGLSALVGARGRVCPVSEDHRHLAATLADGRHVVGQHRITGRGDGGASAADPPVARLYLVGSLDDPTPVPASAPLQVLNLIAEADLICFPMGSFFTSVLAALLPEGIAAAVAAAPAPKVYVPNPAGDVEERGLTMEDTAGALARVLGTPLDTVVVDGADPRGEGDEGRRLEAAGVRVVRVGLRARADPSRYDDEAVLRALWGLLPAGAADREFTAG